MPRFEPDFAGVFASTPIWSKGDYELAIESVRGQAWDQVKDGHETGVIVKVVKLRPKIKGMYDSNGKLITEVDGVDIADQAAEEISLWIHSKGAMAMSKRAIMAILGYDEKEEEEFNNYLRGGNLDLSFDFEESDEGYDVTLGSGWESLAGKLVGAHLDKQQVNIEGREPFEQQQYIRFFPAGS